MEAKQQPPYPLRMPAEMRAQLEEAATAIGRSLHSEILRRLQDSLEPDEPGATDDFNRQHESEAEFRLGLTKMLVEARQNELCALAFGAAELIELLPEELPPECTDSVRQTKLHVETVISTYHVPDEEKVRLILEEVDRASKAFIESVEVVRRRYQGVGDESAM